MCSGDLLADPKEEPEALKPETSRLCGLRESSKQGSGKVGWGLKGLCKEIQEGWSTQKWEHKKK